MTLPVWYVHIKDWRKMGAYVAAADRGKAKYLAFRQARDADFTVSYPGDMVALRCHEGGAPAEVELSGPRALATYEVTGAVGATDIRIDIDARWEAKCAEARRLAGRTHERVGAMEP